MYKLDEVLGRYYAQQLFLKRALDRGVWFGVEQVVSFDMEDIGCEDARMFNVSQATWEADLKAQGFDAGKKSLFNLLGTEESGTFLRAVGSKLSVGSEMLFETTMTEGELEDVFHDTGVLVYEYADARVTFRQYLKGKFPVPKGIGYCLAVRHR